MASSNMIKSWKQQQNSPIDKLMTMVAPIVLVLVLLPTGSMAHMPQLDDHAKSILHVLSSSDCDPFFGANQSRSCAEAFSSAAAKKTVSDLVYQELGICCGKLKKGGESCLHNISKEHAELMITLGKVCHQLSHSIIEEKCNEIKETKKARKLSSEKYKKKHNKVRLLTSGLRLVLSLSFGLGI
ncbi:hypothetical protein ACP70R_008412 [Stipagrostis hirtigluma subsp. patula]